MAKEDPKRAFLSLAHHIDIDLLREANRRTRKDSAPGVDGQTAAAYQENLEENLQSLLDRFKSGRYQAPPVRRAYVPKGSDPLKKRPIGMPTFEDKVLQRAVAMVLEAVYEQDFLDCSYGFRPGRSAHQAIRKLWQGLTSLGGGWVLEADIQSFYDTLDRSQLRSFLDQRVRDGVIRRALDKWLKAGVMEGTTLSHPLKGTPQGGVISPLLSNIYLHEVLDTWFEAVVKPRLQGEAFLIRFADDFVLVFQLESDARRVLKVLPERFAKYGLSLHPDKTRLVRFEQPGSKTGLGKTQPHEGPKSFDFLGFTHFWERSRRGNWMVKRKTASDRITRFLRQLNQWCQGNRHAPIAWQQKQLLSKLRGHSGYYGITGNSKSLSSVHHWVKRIWRKWLSRRTRDSYLTWDRFNLLLRRYPLPNLRICHSA
ncbi:MAG: group II intron reverse transcriptase/maturase [Thermoanaerobaculia bacterium]